MSRQLHAVTGAYGYLGRYLAQRLLDQGRQVITLNNSPIATILLLTGSRLIPSISISRTS